MKERETELTEVEAVRMGTVLEEGIEREKVAASVRHLEELLSLCKE
jgi:hypothetical protein